MDCPLLAAQQPSCWWWGDLQLAAVVRERDAAFLLLAVAVREDRRGLPIAGCREWDWWCCWKALDMRFEGIWCHREKRKREREGGKEACGSFRLGKGLVSLKNPNSFCYFIYLFSRLTFSQSPTKKNSHLFVHIFLIRLYSYNSNLVILEIVIYF